LFFELPEEVIQFVEFGDQRVRIDVELPEKFGNGMQRPSVFFVMSSCSLRTFRFSHDFPLTPSQPTGPKPRSSLSRTRTPQPTPRLRSRALWYNKSRLQLLAMLDAVKQKDLNASMPPRARR
jgi:hypothetical protein